MKWLEKGHGTMKKLFASFMECGHRSLITKLEDDQGRNISLVTKMGKRCRDSN